MSHFEKGVHSYEVKSKALLTKIIRVKMEQVKDVSNMPRWVNK